VQRGAPERCAAERHPARAAAGGAASPPGLNGMDAWAATEPHQASHAHAAARAGSRTAPGPGGGARARAGSARGRSGSGGAAAAARQQDAGAASAPGRAWPEGDGGGGRARARAPTARLRLHLQDVRPALVGARLQVLWPEDGRWWPGTVTALDARGRRATLLYETGARAAGTLLGWLSRPKSCSLHLFGKTK